MENTQGSADTLYQELVPGRDDFKEKTEAMTKRQVSPGLPGRPSVNEEQAIYSIIWYIRNNCALTLITRKDRGRIAPEHPCSKPV